MRSSGLVLEPETGPGLFLGCIHERVKKTINGVEVQGFEYNMESYLLDTVKRYCTLVEELTGRKVNLSTRGRVPTPFLPEDNREAPAGRPLGEGPACLCPHCLASFPVWGEDESPPRGIGPLS